MQACCEESTAAVLPPDFRKQNCSSGASFTPNLGTLPPPPTCHGSCLPSMARAILEIPFSWNIEIMACQSDARLVLIASQGSYKCIDTHRALLWYVVISICKKPVFKNSASYPRKPEEWAGGGELAGGRCRNEQRHSEEVSPGFPRAKLTAE